jgi:phosphomannomutase/phosphoglucomutase
MSDIAANIFRAYDIRGITPEPLGANAAYLIGRALAAAAVARNLTTIAVARDGRLSGADLLSALAAGICDSGVDVADIDLAPTPLAYFAAYKLAAGSAAVVTGSHNPKQYNGVKIMLGGDALAGDAVADLRRRIIEDDYPLPRAKGVCRRADVRGDYIGEICAKARLTRPLKIVLDCGNGAAGVVAPDVFRALGCEVTELFCEVDGAFPNHHPDPAKLENLQDAKRALAQSRADAAFVFDGDGDRLGVIIPGGEVIAPDRALLAFARAALAKHPGATIICDVKCTANFAPWIKRFGGIPRMCRTGHSFIKRELRQSGALLAGEMSGHFFFADDWPGFDDGIYAAAQMAQLAAAAQGGLGEVFADVPDSPATPELQIPMENPRRFVDEFARAAKFPNAKRINDLDGVRAEYADGFGLLRASNTTPSLVLRFEGENAAALARIQDDFRAALQAAGAKPPF